MIDSTGYVFVNGRLVSAANASVSVFDRGLLYGDGLFETMRAYRGVVFALEDHLDRLRTSARILALPVPEHEWRDVCGDLLRRNGLRRGDAWVRLMITRGAGEPGLLPPDPPEPTTIVMAGKVSPDHARWRQHGVPVMLLPFAREGFLAEHKSLNYLSGVFGKALAARHDAYEGLYVDSGESIREGTTSSLFVVKDGVVSTVPLGGILPGVTRRIVIDLAVAAQIRVIEQRITAADLRQSDEAFLTSSVAEIVPIVRVDESRIGSGRPGPVTRRLQRLYQAAVKRHREQRLTT
jgi:branched-chain amino acid aminotransferase